MEIVWTALAKESLKDVITYIDNIWNPRIALKVRKELYQKISLLQNSPHSGKMIGFKMQDDTKIRVLIVNKKTKVFYFCSDRIYIVLIWNVKRNPLLLKAKLHYFFS